MGFNFGGWPETVGLLFFRTDAVLNAYTTLTQQLLLNPAAPVALYPVANIQSFINIARNQIAGESECVRVYGSLALTTNTRSYPFSAINISSVTGVASVIHIRQASVVIAGGQAYVRTRGFPWFQQYLMNEVVPRTGLPQTYAQYAQGILGSLYIHPLPDQAYTLKLDTVCLPVPLIDDTTPEAIPSLWTDAVPYFAAYMALTSAQRITDADRMYKLFEEFMGRARKAATSSVLPGLNPQQIDPTTQNKLGSQSGGGAG